MYLTVIDSVYCSVSTGDPEFKDMINYGISIVGIVISTFFSILVILMTRSNNKRLKAQEAEQQKFYLYIAKNEAQKILDVLNISEESFYISKERINTEIPRNLNIPSDSLDKHFSSEQRIILRKIWEKYNDWLKDHWINNNEFKQTFTDIDRENIIADSEIKYKTIKDLISKL